MNTLALARIFSLLALAMLLGACTVLTAAGSAVIGAGSTVVSTAAKAGGAVVDAVTPSPSK